MEPLTEFEALQLMYTLRSQGWHANAMYESLVDGHPARWTVTVTKRRGR